MFEPTIKYRRVNEPPKKDIAKSLDEMSIADGKPAAISTSTKEKEDSVTEVNEGTQDTKATAATTEEKEEFNPIDEIKVEEQPEPENTASSPAATVITEPDYTFEEEEEDSTIQVDPNDKERIIVTLSTGKQFSADRYCPHAGADLSFHGKVSEHDYPPEIGPILMCPIHYWEFALEKDGKGGGGWATINACPVEVAEKCASSAEKKKLDW
jgi:nitrite reductase/ring-hydroxylating ferredoxin subunit